MRIIDRAKLAGSKNTMPTTPPQASVCVKELLNLREIHNAEFKSLERTIKLEMDALRKNIEDWRESDKSKYELILKLIEKQNNN